MDWDKWRLPLLFIAAGLILIDILIEVVSSSSVLYSNIFYVTHPMIIGESLDMFILGLPYV